MPEQLKSRTTFPDFPEGTVTFLFTDIEGSTQLLSRLRDQYAILLADQRNILREAFTKWNGSEIDTQGDAFFVAFPRATDAVSAVVDIQRALATHTWPQDVEVRVRMGLHTGEPLTVEEGYVGMDVHRAARIAHVGHGGQVLLSETSAALVRDELPDGVTLVDLGRHRLKDLHQLEYIRQLMIAGLPTKFPKLKSLDTLPTNLPTQLTSFVRREREMEQVKDLLNEGRLVTLTGPGGTGKTRISLQVAAEVVDEYEHGVWFVELAPLTSIEYIVPTVADALNFTLDNYLTAKDSSSQLVDYLRHRSMLLVMDNFEHLSEGANLLAELLEGAPEVKILATSREKLNLREEWAFDLGGMSYPKNGDGTDVEEYNALKLFVRRARQVNSNFTLSEEDKRWVVNICQTVEGMPLAIELAAAWSSALSCEEIAKEIDQSLDFLSTTMRDVPHKHRSLRAVFDHSWASLTKRQKAGLRKLSVFNGGFQRQAALSIADVDLGLLSDFINKSLLKRRADGRYDIHQLLKQYLTEILKSDQDEWDALRERHSQYYMRFLELRAPLLEGQEMVKTRNEIRAESGNIRAAIYWVILHWDETQARNILAFTSSYYNLRGWHEAMNALGDIARHLREKGAGKQPGTWRRSVLLSALVFHYFYRSLLGDLAVEQKCLEILSELRELDLQKELGVCLESLGICALFRGEFAQSIEYLQESLGYYKEFREIYLNGSCMLFLGWAFLEKGDYKQAESGFMECYQFCKRYNNRTIQSFALDKLGIAADAMGEYTKALDYHQQALEIHKEHEFRSGQGYALSRMSLSAWGMGEYKGARQYACEAFQIFKNTGHSWGMSSSLCRLGFAELGLGKIQAAENSFYRGLESALEFNYVNIGIFNMIGFGSLYATQGTYGRSAELLSLAIHHPTTPASHKDLAQSELTRLEKKMSPEDLAKAAEKGRISDYETVAKEILSKKNGVNDLSSASK